MLRVLRHIHLYTHHSYISIVYVSMLYVSLSVLCRLYLLHFATPPHRAPPRMRIFSSAYIDTYFTPFTHHQQHDEHCVIAEKWFARMQLARPSIAPAQLKRATDDSLMMLQSGYFFWFCVSTETGLNLNRINRPHHAIYSLSPFCHRASSDAPSSKRSSTGRARKTNSVAFCASIATAVSIVA